MAYSAEVRERARNLYVVEGYTFERLGEETGVNASTLWRWAQQDGWRAMRDDLRADLDDIRVNTIHLRKKLIKGVLESLEDKVDPMKIFAVSSLESAAAKLAKDDQAGELQTTVTRKIETMGDAADALHDVVELKLNRLLSRPEAVSLKEIKDMKAALALVEELKNLYAAPETAKDVTEEDRQTLLDRVDEILGVK